MTKEIAFSDNPTHKQNMENLANAIISELDVVEFHTEHHFANGCYARECHIPAGHVVVGKIHRHPCINIMSAGKAKIVTDENTYEVQAPYTFISGAGVTKVVYAIEDVVFINIHPWNGEDDLDELEKKCIIPSLEALEEEKKLLLGEDK